MNKYEEKILFNRLDNDLDQENIGNKKYLKERKFQKNKSKKPIFKGEDNSKNAEKS